MHVEPENPYSGFMRQFRRTRAIESLASVSRTFFAALYRILGPEYLFNVNVVG